MAYEFGVTPSYVENHTDLLQDLANCCIQHGLYFSPKRKGVAATVPVARLQQQVHKSL